MSPKELTYKSKDTEEYLDKIFYRPAGYLIALISRKIGLTPNIITSISVISGIAGSMFFLPVNMYLNITGILLLILSDIFDSADGQLARLSNISSRFGRILDGVGGNLIFLAIYIVLCLRLMNDGFGITIIIIALISAASHSFQSSIADYYRNIFIKYTSIDGKSELEYSKDLHSNLDNMSWKESFFKKLLFQLYYSHTKEQEFLSRDFLIFDYFVKSNYQSIPEYLRNYFKSSFKSMIKYYNFLTINSRIAALSVVILVNRPLYYFAFEIILMNIIFVYVLICHKIKFRELFSKIKIDIS